MLYHKIDPPRNALEIKYSPLTQLNSLILQDGPKQQQEQVQMMMTANI